MKQRFREIKELPLDDLVIGKAQVRTRETGREIAELAESIRRVGLLEPIVVAPVAAKPGKFEIITGQRRFLAHQEIQASTILSAILHESVDELEAKIISLTENVMRRDLNNKDLIDVCTVLYKRYGSVKAVSEETGIPQDKIRDFVKYDRLGNELKELVDSGEVRMREALRAQDAANAAGIADPRDAVKIAREFSTMSGAQQDRLVKERAANPYRPIDEVIEEQKTSKKIVQIVVTLSANMQQHLNDFAKAETTSQDDAARLLIEEGLSLKGYGEMDE